MLSKDNAYQMTAIMTALNEEGNVADAMDNALTAFSDCKIHGELLVFNDGSTDATSEIVNAYVKRYSNVRLVNHDKPKGVGGCFWEGTQLAQGEVVVCIPGDGENDCRDVFRYYPLMQDVDIIIPFIYNREVRTLGRQMLSKIYKAIINLSFGLLLNYMNGTVIYRKSILRKLELKNTGFFFQTELLIKTIRRGYLYAEVPQALKLRSNGKSKAVSFKSFVKVVIGYFETMIAVNLLDKKQASIVEDSVTHTRRLRITHYLSHQGVLTSEST